MFIFRITRCFFIPLFIAFASSTEFANACTISWHPQEAIEREAEFVVQGRVISARHVSSSVFRESYEYEVELKQIERGSSTLRKLLVTYEDLKPHERAEVKVCPRKYGSGIEYALSPGRTYRLYLRSSTKPEVFLAQPVEE